MIDSAVLPRDIPELDFKLFRPSKTGLDLYDPTSATAITPDIDRLHVDYASRRMSASASSVDSELSSAHNKRAASPSDVGSPQSDYKRPRTDADLAAAVAAEQPPYPTSDPDASGKVQLPSICSFGDSYRRASPDDARANRGGPQYTVESARSAPASQLNTYQFPPPPAEQSQDGRPRVNTHLSPNGAYTSSPYSATTGSSSSYYGYGYSAGTTPSSGWPASAISRPSSTPNEPSEKYEESVRHHGPVDMFAGIARLTAQDRRYSTTSATADYSLSPETHPGSYPSTPIPSIAVSSHTSNHGDQSSANHDSPSIQPAVPIVPSNLVERAPRKRGKLPKPVTDYLKDWLHRHSDHPYPSEEEKKQLCHATGLSMSQVSNWMINARRRILAPAQRAAQAPTTTAPYAAGRAASMTSTLVANARRASMPTSVGSDSMQLYHPSSMGAIYGHPHSAHAGAADYLRLSMPRTAHGGYGSMEYSGYRLTYPGAHGHPHAAGGYVSSGIPMSAPPSLAGGPFSAGISGSMQALYAPSAYRSQPAPATANHDSATPPTQEQNGDARYYGGSHTASPQPGNGYTTPQ
ncbi:hypothetical protein PUNSTDRAFT_141073 [Punctularia strigosozonata HHB-11173 SS5]|uniref:uncharacterized protein n=1 Tax=Punctularia strigosozonata (strain HHB-11173) TaxID=741275 RepID=UPI0004416321|nr:uncharacterized protein PUNSTDRAFT_141073 [Punctularia strigosozonata HHB-11173 SS5]EIN12331.1 hypothetical protein PUNSTDRAFT_141073 [Punctularia strigosozonata HHB-11173 SS5]